MGPPGGWAAAPAGRILTGARRESRWHRGGTSRHGREPGPPHPRARLHEAIDAFENSELARKAFGEAILEHYLHFARTQQDAFEARVTDFERKRYFERM